MELDYATSHPYVPGLDQVGQNSFNNVWRRVYPWLLRVLSIDDDWHDMPAVSVRTNLLTRFQAFERAQLRPDANLRADRDNSLLQYQQIYLLPLAQSLGFIDYARTSILSNLVRRSLLKLPQTTSNTALTLEAQFSAIVHDSATTRMQRLQLLDAGACRNEAAASRILATLGQVNDRAAAMARSLILASIEFGWVGLLRHAPLPYVDALLHLQSQADMLLQLSATPRAVLGNLRADLIALGQSLMADDALPSKDWPVYLLHLPPTHPQRIAVQNKLSARTNEHIEQLAVLRGCSIAEAERIWIHLLQGGLTELITWRCHVGVEAAQQNVTVRRIERAVAVQLASLPVSARTRACDLLLHLHDSCQEAGVQLPIVRLINHHPSGIYRVKLGRRLRFGVPAIVSRRQHKQRRKGKRRWQQDRQKDNSLFQVHEEDQLVAAFVRRAGMVQVSAGRDVLRQFVTYGALGMFRRGEWPELIDRRIFSLLTFFKLGCPDGRLHWSALMQQLRSYAAEKNISAPTSQIARAVFNSIPKPSGWHGGYGEAVATVRQRATLVLNAPCLHDSWVVLQVQRKLQGALYDENGHKLGDTAVITVVFEEQSELPVGVWVDVQTHLGLALHQALWQPGHVDWPLRGIPGVIKIADTLLKGHSAEMERAINWIQSDVQTLSAVQLTRQRQRMLKAEELLARLTIDGLHYVQQRCGSSSITQRTAIEGLRLWLRLDSQDGGRCFPNHRVPPLPTTSLTYGMAILPGYDLPVAGLLVPIVGTTSTRRNALVHRNQLYTAPDFQTEPGRTVSVRALPYLTANVPDHIFVDDADGSLHCLLAQKPVMA
jgi:hypothetical protein